MPSEKKRGRLHWMTERNGGTGASIAHRSSENEDQMRRDSIGTRFPSRRWVFC
jgi:hypothetical protein